MAQMTELHPSFAWDCGAFANADTILCSAEKNSFRKGRPTPRVILNLLLRNRNPFIADSTPYRVVDSVGVYRIALRNPLALRSDPSLPTASHRE